MFCCFQNSFEQVLWIVHAQKEHFDRLPIARQLDWRKFEHGTRFRGAFGSPTNNDDPSNSRSRYSERRHKSVREGEKKEKHQQCATSLNILLSLHLDTGKLKQTVTPAKVAVNVNGTSFHIFHYFDASHHHSFVLFTSLTSLGDALWTKTTRRFSLFILSRLLKMMKMAWQCRNVRECKRRCDMHRATLIECDIYCELPATMTRRIEPKNSKFRWNSRARL